MQFCALASDSIDAGWRIHSVAAECKRLPSALTLRVVRMEWWSQSNTLSYTVRCCLMLASAAASLSIALWADHSIHL